MAGKAIPGAIFGGTGITVSPEGIISIISGLEPNGGDDAPGIQAAIDAAGAAFIETGIQQTVLLGSGEFQIASPILCVSGVVLEIPLGTVLRPADSWTPDVADADDPINALIQAVTTGWAATTTLSAHCYGETRKLTVVSSAGFSVGEFVRVVSTVAHLDIDNPFPGTRYTCALVSAIPNGTTLILDRPVCIVHGSGSSVEKTAAGLRNCGITGEGHIDASGRTFAVGILLDGVLDPIVAAPKMSGFSRAAVNLRGGCNGAPAPIEVLHAGENNAAILAEQCHAMRLYLRSTGTGPRYHANGLVRCLITVRWRSGHTFVDGRSDIRNGAGGICLKGSLSGGVKAGHHIEDQDCTIRAYGGRPDPDDAFINAVYSCLGAAVEITAGNDGGTLGERPHGTIVEAGTWVDCKHPDWQGTQGAFFAVNVFSLHLAGPKIINTGDSSSTQQAGTLPTYKYGLVFGDCYLTTVGDYYCRGVEAPLIFLFGWNHVHISRVEIDPTSQPLGTTDNILVGQEAFVGGQGPEVVIDEMLAHGDGYLFRKVFHSTFQPTTCSWRGFQINRLTLYPYGVTIPPRHFDDVILAKNYGGEWAGGECAQMRPMAKTIAPADINTSSDQVTMTAHPYGDGDLLLWSSSGALPAGLPGNNLTWVVSRSANGFFLSSTDPAISTTYVNFTTQGTGTHTLTGGPIEIVTPTTAIAADKSAVVGPLVIAAQTSAIIDGWVPIARGSAPLRIADSDYAMPGRPVEPSGAGLRTWHALDAPTNIWGYAQESKGAGAVQDVSTRSRVQTRKVT